MPTHDRLGLHNDQGRSPILPRLGEEDPKQSVARTEVRTPDRASENPQLLTQCQVFKRDGSVTTYYQIGFAHARRVERSRIARRLSLA
jgi:hypothetical protein